MTADEKALLDQFPYLKQDEYFDIHGYKKRPEIFPGEEILAINKEHKAEDIWWTIEDKDRSGVLRRTINAKAESVLFTDMFKTAFKTDRVLIPADAIFEWHTNPDKTKTKYQIWFDEPVFAFGGIVRECEIKGKVRRCGVILTTRANEIFSEIHNSKQRQPVVIHKYDHEKWLDPSTHYQELKPLLEPLASDETHFAPVDESKAPANQASLFGEDESCDW